MTKADNKIIDLFCGCGGFSLGAHLAGFKSVLAVDIDPILSSAYKLNFPKAKLANLDLSQVKGKDLLKMAEEKNVFGVIGGPPCQGFSMMGKRDENDPRNELIGHYFKHIKSIQPAFFVMENVPGLIAGKMREKLDRHLSGMKKKYKIVGPIIVNAAGLGAPTKRERVLVIGYDKKVFHEFSEQDILNLHSDDSVSVQDAIGDLPSPVFCDEGEYGWAKYDGRKKISPYALAARTAPKKGYGWKPAVEKMKSGYVSGLMDTVHAKPVANRYEALEPGKTDPVSRSFRLDWSGQCPTLRAGTGSDKGSYQAVRPIHPDKGRVITVREAARLQGFPDWYVFHPTKWHSFRMIGNSVSPHLSQKILSFIKRRRKKPS